MVVQSKLFSVSTMIYSRIASVTYFTSAERKPVTLSCTADKYLQPFRAWIQVHLKLNIHGLSLVKKRGLATFTLDVGIIALSAYVDIHNTKIINTLHLHILTASNCIMLIFKVCCIALNFLLQMPFWKTDFTFNTYLEISL